MKTSDDFEKSLEELLEKEIQRRTIKGLTDYVVTMELFKKNPVIILQPEYYHHIDVLKFPIDSNTKYNYISIN